MSIRSVSDREKCAGLHYCIIQQANCPCLQHFSILCKTTVQWWRKPPSYKIEDRSDLTWCTSIHTVMMAGQANLDALAGAPTKGSGWEALALLVALFHSCKMILGNGMIMDQPESKVPIVMQIIFGPTAPSWQKSLLLQFSWRLVPLKQSPVVWLPYQIRYFESARMESKYPALFGCLFGGHGWSDTWIG